MNNTKIKDIDGLEEILKKQCKMVGADYSKIDFKKEHWFWDYEWTEEKQDKFIEWLTEYIKKNKKARSRLMSIPSTNKNSLERFAREFTMNFGWKNKEIKK